MNADTPVSGLRDLQKRLNFDGAYGIALLGVCALLALVEIGGEASRKLLAYDREAIAGGALWRVLSAHFVHLDAEHAILNTFGVVLMWSLFARDFSAGRWLAIYLFAGLGIGVGLWLRNPDVIWYVGASGALHGVMTAGTLAHLRRGDLDGWLLAAIIVAKLAYEQYAGSMPFSESGNTIIDAHLYGAFAGLVLASFLRSNSLP